MEDLGRLKYNTAPGLGGLRNEHITALKLNPRRIMTPSASVVLDHYFSYSVAVMKVELPLWFYEVESAVRLVPANKVDPRELPPNMTPDARPVGVGTAERRHRERVYYDTPTIASFNIITAPIQNGVGLKAGMTISVFAAQAQMEAAPGHEVHKKDLMNGYNEVKRSSVMEELTAQESLEGLYAYTHAMLTPMSFIGMGSGTNLTAAPFRSEEGLQQGAVPSGYLFTLGCNKAYQRANRDLNMVGGAMFAIIDDHYLQGPPRSLLEVNTNLALDLAEVGLTVRNDKSQAYVRADFLSPDAAHWRDGIPASCWFCPALQPLYGRGDQVPV